MRTNFCLYFVSMSYLIQDQFRELASTLQAEQGHRFCWHGGRWWWHDGEAWTRHLARSKLEEQIFELRHRLPDNNLWGKIKRDLGTYWTNNQILGKLSNALRNDYGLPCPQNPPAPLPEVEGDQFIR